MKKNKRSLRAMTLIELIIASVLVGVMTFGLIAAEQGIRMSRQSASRDNQVSTQLQAAMTLLTHDANLTSGDATDTGIYQYSDAEQNTTCFREASGDANRYNDDKWHCWSVKKADGNLISIHGADGFNDMTDPNIDAQDWGFLSDLDFFSLVDVDNNVIAPPVGGGISIGRVLYLKIHLETLFNTQRSMHPIENPEYILETYISPSGLSR